MNIGKIKNARKAILAAAILCTTGASHAQHYSWAHQFEGRWGTNGDAVTTDAAGNIYVTGRFGDTVDFDPSSSEAKLVGVGADIYIAKYNNGGNYINAFSISGRYNKQATGIVTDKNGNIYVTGYFDAVADFDPSAATVELTSNGSSDIFLAKYDATGKYLWAINMGNTKDWDGGEAIALDKNGNVYITGYFTGTVDFDPSAATANLTATGNEDIFVAQYDPSGNYLLAYKLGGSLYEFGEHIKVDENDNIYIAGYFEGTVDFDPGAGNARLTADEEDAFIAKYDATGKYLWVNGIGGDGDKRAGGLALDKEGNCFLSGHFSGVADFNPTPASDTITSNGDDDIFIAKYSKDGAYIWAKRIGGRFGDNCYGLTLDKDYNITITGGYDDTVDFDPSSNIAMLANSSSQGIYIARYDSSGKYLGAAGLSATNGHSRGNGVATDADGNAYVTGDFNGTVDFDPSATGTVSYTSGGSGSSFLGRYNAKGFSFIGKANSQHDAVSIYPNPAQDILTVKTDGTAVAIEVMSIDGKILLRSNESRIHYINIHSLPQGNYLIKAGNSVAKFVKQ